MVTPVRNLPDPQLDWTGATGRIPSHSLTAQALGCTTTGLCCSPSLWDIPLPRAPGWQERPWSPSGLGAELGERLLGLGPDAERQGAGLLCGPVLSPPHGHQGA